MKWNIYIKKLKLQVEEDDLMDEQVDLWDILDYAGEIGISGAAEAYGRLLSKVKPRASQL